MYTVIGLVGAAVNGGHGAGRACGLACARLPGRLTNVAAYRAPTCSLAHECRRPQSGLLPHIRLASQRLWKPSDQCVVRFHGPSPEARGATHTHPCRGVSDLHMPPFAIVANAPFDPRKYLCRNVLYVLYIAIGAMLSGYVRDVMSTLSGALEGGSSACTWPVCGLLSVGQWHWA
jgi:hypothetical protein